MNYEQWSVSTKWIIILPMTLLAHNPGKDYVQVKALYFRKFNLFSLTLKPVITRFTWRRGVVARKRHREDGYSLEVLGNKVINVEEDISHEEEENSEILVADSNDDHSPGTNTY